MILKSYDKIKFDSTRFSGGQHRRPQMHGVNKNVK